MSEKVLVEVVTGKATVYIFFIWFTLCAGTASLAGTRDDVRSVFVTSVKELKIPGAVMCVETPEGEKWTMSTGVGVINPRMPVSAGHRFRIGSITKTFVASLVLMLVSEGKVELDARVHSILPDMIAEDNPVTIRHLLQMRSNLGNFADNRAFLAEFRTTPRKKWTPEGLLEFRRCPCGPSGTIFEYSNSNYVLLGLILERLTGDTFENQVQKRILGPLKFRSTSFPTCTRMRSPYARGYDYNPETGRVKDLSRVINPSWAWCSGNGVSTARDIMVWLKSYLNGYGIDEDILHEQFCFKPAMLYGVSYGLGLMNKADAIGHNGDFAGIYTSLAFRYRGYYFVILTNGQTYGAGQDATAESVFWQVVNKSGLFTINPGTETVAKN
ncbi:serine hydrolase domain-containing protein [Maridesulfovibrio sp.]|uniref:serine hydrolase domain-containing protein n=1 Tax=Maridesulfovibrio sp. TaxID=2795000 RepID=UPI002A18E03B|nr:serine hydrolase domain-containing protein [Maridesulfovibrio sp.]